VNGARRAEAETAGPGREAPPLTEAQAFTTVGFLLSQLGAANARRFRDVLAPTGLEPRQFAVLRHLAQSEGRSQQALADHLAIPPSRMVALIDELEERGLVERRPNPEDRRARALFLTRAGRRVLGRATTLGLDHEAALCSVLGPGERQQLIELLQRIAGSQGLRPGVHPELVTGEAPPEP
jgi:DNA-binding MarR family transcriptional regulator